MSHSALLQNGVEALPACVNSDLVTTPFRQPKRPQIKYTSIKLKTITTLALVLLILAAALPQTNQAANIQTFSGSLNTARDHHTATLLPNDKVLAAEGHGVSGDLTPGGYYHTATILGFSPYYSK